MASSIEKSRFAMIHQFLPEEIMVLILKKLDYQTLSSAFQVCVKWSELIHGFHLFNIGNFGKFCLTIWSIYFEIFTS